VTPESYAFVAMPFEVRKHDLLTYHENPEHWSEVLESLIAPACADTGLRSVRDDQDQTSRVVFDRILEKLHNAELVICDLSSGNPNVFLELGWALRDGKRVVLIVDDVTGATFDTQSLFSVPYSHTLRPREVADARSRLAEAIRQTLVYDGPSFFGSAVASHKVREQASEGNPQAALLTELLSEVRAVTRWAVRAPAPTVPPSVRIFVHEHSFTRVRGLQLLWDLSVFGIDATIATH
jgi:hypothetical protein